MAIVNEGVLNDGDYTMNKKGIEQFLKFCIVGVSNTALSYILNVSVLYILAPLNVAWDFFAGNTVAFLLSVLWSFYWNNKYVFSDKEENIKENSQTLIRKLIKTYLSYGITGIILCNILSYVWINIFEISKMIAPLINLIVSVPLNFIMNKLWAFKTD